MNDIRFSELKRIIKRKSPDSNKGTNGTLNIVAGSERYRGAAVLSVLAAERCGVGIVRLASVEKVISSVSVLCPEAVFLPLSEGRDGGISASDFDGKLKNISSSRALLVGCGMGNSIDTNKIVTSLLYNCDIPLIIDADGLNSIKDFPEILLKAKHTPIITPHIGELSRLSGLSVDTIKKDRLSAARNFAEKYNTIVVLKDSVSIVVTPNGETFVCDKPNPALAKGGSGDVLSGIISSFVAQGYNPFEAALCGVSLHSLAAELGAKDFTEFSMLPSDIIKYIPAVFSEILKEGLDKI